MTKRKRGSGDENSGHNEANKKSKSISDLQKEARIFEGLSNNFIKNGDISKAIYYLEKASNNYNSMNCDGQYKGAYNLKFAEIASNLGDLHLKNNQVNEAIEHYTNASQFYNFMNMNGVRKGIYNKELAEINYTLGELQQSKDINSSVIYFSNASRFFEQLQTDNKFPEGYFDAILINTYMALSSLYNISGQMLYAATARQKAQAVCDSLNEKVDNIFSELDRYVASDNEASDNLPQEILQKVRFLKSLQKFNFKMHDDKIENINQGIKNYIEAKRSLLNEMRLKEKDQAAEVDVAKILAGQLGKLAEESGMPQTTKSYEPNGIMVGSGENIKNVKELAGEAAATVGPEIIIID